MTNFKDLVKKLMENSDMPVTFGMEKWTNEGAVVTEAALAKVHQIQMDDITLGRGGEGRFRPSMIGYGCNRAQLLSFIGFPQDEAEDLSSHRVMNNGTWGHYRWQVAGLSAGWLQDIEVKVSYEPWHLRGAVDGILADGSGFELKTTSSRSFYSTKEPKPSHLLQVHAYMRALDIDKFSIVYENRDTVEYKEYRVHRDPAVDWELDAMFNTLNSHLDAQQLPEMLPACIAKSSNNFQYKYCNWQQSCPTAQFSTGEQ